MRLARTVWNSVPFCSGPGSHWRWWWRWPKLCWKTFRICTSPMTKLMSGGDGMHLERRWKMLIMPTWNMLFYMCKACGLCLSFKQDIVIIGVYMCHYILLFVWLLFMFVIIIVFIVIMFLLLLLFIIIYYQFTIMFSW